MPQWRDFLDRFRPAGAPGAAAPRGVPADRAAELTAELTPLLARLDRVQAAIEYEHDTATQRAERIREAGHREAVAIIERAHADSARIADEAMTQRLSETTSGSPATTAAAEQVRTLTRERMPAYVHATVEVARTLIARLCDPVEL
ncbi:hypothetical protein OHB26_27395 [Nocardia sp. NBC_01503]|uniref:hypothetical protein n=1 Tax=Nocardia sp. NBC_01503 TaxID=2975997 RepID=UPI002E7B5B9C|nr:hypothetical protein [Nocardia sp. NBC_01503]WTL30636.1 hypothetical protein OHB26_27395 [Nocardia sp. NBC_01503]